MSDFEQALEEAVKVSKNPDRLKAIIQTMEIYDDVKGYVDFDVPSKGVEGALQYFIASSDELVERHPDYADRVNASHEFYMTLTEEQREALLNAAQEVAAYVYKHAESWLPYSLVLQADSTNVVGVGFYFNIIFADLNQIIREKKETTVLEAAAALEELTDMMSVPENYGADTIDVGALSVVFPVDASNQIIEKAEALGLDPAQYVAAAVAAFDA